MASVKTLEDAQEIFLNNNNPVWILYQGTRVTETSVPIAQHKHSVLSTSWHDLAKTIVKFGKGNYIVDTRKNNSNANGKMYLPIDLNDYRFDKYVSTYYPEMNGLYGHSVHHNTQAYPPQQQQQTTDPTIGLIMEMNKNLMSSLLKKQETPQIAGQINSRYTPEVEDHIEREVERRELRLEKQLEREKKVEIDLIENRFRQKFHELTMKVKSSPMGNVFNAIAGDVNKNGMDGLSKIIAELRKPKNTAQIGVADADVEIPETEIPSAEIPSAETPLESSKKPKGELPNLHTTTIGVLQIHKLTGFDLSVTIAKIAKKAKEDPEGTRSQLNLLQNYL